MRLSDDEVVAAHQLERYERRVRQQRRDEMWDEVAYAVALCVLVLLYVILP